VTVEAAAMAIIGISAVATAVMAISTCDWIAAAVHAMSAVRAAAIPSSSLMIVKATWTWLVAAVSVSFDAEWFDSNLLGPELGIEGSSPSFSTEVTLSSAGARGLPTHAAAQSPGTASPLVDVATVTSLSSKPASSATAASIAPS